MNIDLEKNSSTSPSYKGKGIFETKNKKIALELRFALSKEFRGVWWCLHNDGAKSSTYYLTAESVWGSKLPQNKFDDILDFIDNYLENKLETI